LTRSTRDNRKHLNKRNQPAEYCGRYLRYDEASVSRAVLNTFWSMLQICDVRLWVLDGYRIVSQLRQDIAAPNGGIIDSTLVPWCPGGIDALIQRPKTSQQ
jgi:hypothetical protein